MLYTILEVDLNNIVDVVQLAMLYNGLVIQVVSMETLRCSIINASLSKTIVC